MPTRNDQLLAALNHPDLATYQQGAYKAALDAIIYNYDRNPGNAAAFRKAIISKRDFWQGLGVIIPAGQVDTDDTFLAVNGTNAGQSFAALYQLAIKKRVSLGLHQAGELLLEKILACNDGDQLRQALASVPDFGSLKTIPNWGTQANAIIIDDILGEIYYEAQYALLLKKISLPTVKIESIDALLTAVEDKDDDAFRIAAQALGISAHSAAQMESKPLNTLQGAAAKTAIAKRGLSLLVEGIPYPMPEVDFEDIKQLLQNDGDTDFLKKLVEPYSGALGRADVPWAKRVFGLRYLQQAFTLQDDADFLKTTARCSTPGELIAHLKDLYGNYNYIDEVAKSSLPALRQAAAKQALQLGIADCGDVDALDGLIAAKSAADIQRVLATNTALGFNNDQPFRAAFAGASDISDIVAAAYVQKSLLSASFDQRKGLVDSGADGALAYYQQEFVGAANSELQAKIVSYLTPERIEKIRQKAFLDCAKTQLAKVEVTNQQVNELALAADLSELQASAVMLMGNDCANDLFDQATGQRFIAFASAELTFRSVFVSAKDLSRADYDTAIGYVNDFGTNPLASKLEALSLKEKQELQTRIVAGLVSRFPEKLGTHPKAQLDSLATAKTDADFRAALEVMGIINHTWVNDFSREQVQKAACSRALYLQFNTSSLFDEATHPQLINLVKVLPVDKQQALLTKPLVVAALQQAKTSKEIREIVADQGIDDALVEALVSENTRLGQLQKIANSKVASILAGLLPPLELDGEQIDQINALVKTPIAGGRSPFANTAGYLGSVARLRDIIPHPGLNAAFGLNAAGTTIEKKAIRIRIQNQYICNEPLVEIENAFQQREWPDFQKSAVRFCLSLKKEEKFTRQHYIDLLHDLKKATSIDDFLQQANTRGTYSLVVDMGSLQKKLTPAMFKRLKVGQSREALLDPHKYQATLKADQTALAKGAALFARIKKGSGKIHSELERLAGTKRIDPLNPAFHAAAQQNAAELAPHLKELAQATDTAVTQLTRRRELIQGQLDGLPLDDDLDGKSIAHQKAIEDHRQNLHRQLEEVNNELAPYKDVQKVLNGDPGNSDPDLDPLLRQGVLKTVEQALAAKHDIRFQFESTYKDYPSHKKADFLKKATGTVIPEDPTSIARAGKIYEAVGAVPNGMIRVHTIAYGNKNHRATGEFIEERGSTKTTTGNGTTGYLPTIKLTVSQFPKGGPGIDLKALHDAKVNYSMAIGCQILAGLHDAPTEDKPIILRGSNEEEVAYLWTALVSLGVKPNAIKVLTPAFNPETQQGVISTFGRHSLYEKGFQGNGHAFKDSPAAKMAAEVLQGANKDKSDKSREHRQMAKDLSQLSRMFKKDLGAALRDAEKSNKEEVAPLIKPRTLSGG